MNTISVDFAIPPLSNVAIAMSTLPGSEPLLDALLPLTIVNFTAGPGVNTFSMSFVIQKLSYVLRLTAIDLIASTVPSITLPLTLIDAAISVDKHAKAMAFPVNQCSLVEGVLRPFYVELVSILYLTEVEQLRDHCIVMSLLFFVEVSLA